MDHCSWLMGKGAGPALVALGHEPRTLSYDPLTLNDRSIDKLIIVNSCRILNYHSVTLTRRNLTSWVGIPMGL